MWVVWLVTKRPSINNNFISSGLISVLKDPIKYGFLSLNSSIIVKTYSNCSDVWKVDHKINVNRNFGNIVGSNLQTLSHELKGLRVLILLGTKELIINYAHRGQIIC